MSKIDSAKKHLSASAVAGLVVGSLFVVLGQIRFAPLVAWDTAALTYVGWIWMTIWNMNSAATKAHAKTEDPGRALADVLLVVASVASLIAVGFMILQAGNSSGFTKAIEIALGLLSVVVSWFVVHTTFTLKYAGQYYSDPEGGIDFNQTKPPQYTDFAYLAFTVGLTFQVSDTNIQQTSIRKIIFKQSLLSYLFGTVIIATTINTIASLGK